MSDWGHSDSGKTRVRLEQTKLQKRNASSYLCEHIPKPCQRRLRHSRHVESALLKWIVMAGVACCCGGHLELRLEEACLGPPPSTRGDVQHLHFSSYRNKVSASDSPHIILSNIFSEVMPC
jgi:hypothetical protein